MFSITAFAEKVRSDFNYEIYHNCQNHLPSINMVLVNVYTISTAILGHLLYRNRLLKMNNKNTAVKDKSLYLSTYYQRSLKSSYW